MTKGELYTQNIRNLDQKGLLSLWDKISMRATLEDGWTDGKALEFLILRAFELGGADVIYPYENRKNGQVLEQIDGVVYYQHLACLIECKDYETDKIDFTPIAKMRSQLLMRPAATIGSIFTFSDFTSVAIEMASYLAPQTILLWENSEIEYVLNNNCIC